MSVSESVLSAFPAPVFLTAGSAGIDISEGSVKCVLLERHGSTSRLASYSETLLPLGTIVAGDIKLPGKIVETLRSVRLRQGIRSANACLPERSGYLYQAVVPGEARDFRLAIEFDLETHVPLSSEEVAFDFETVRPIEGGTVVSVTAYPKRVADAYVQAFRDAGISLRSLEAEPQSIARAVLTGEDRSSVVMIVDLGARATRVIVAEHGVVALSATVGVGGDALTASVAKFFNIPAPEAEAMKSARGFLVNSQNTDLVEAMLSTISVIREEVMQHFSYWNSLSSGAVPHQRIARIILSGGGANLLGLPEYLEGASGAPVSLANVWANACSLDAYIPPLPFGASLAYAAALGLAERGLAQNS
jgi:type IV pilus assembly protein PilM